MLFLAFGLIIDSEIDLTEELPAAPEGSTPDVTIRLGDVPETLEDVKGDGTFYQLNTTEFRFEVEAIAAYYAREGNEILVQVAENADLAGVRLFLLGSTFGAILHQRRLLPLHASSLKTDKGAVLFCGRSGVGKSTMAAALSKRGYPLLTDDISVLALNEEGVPVVMPGAIRQKMWANSLRKLSIEYESMERIRPEIEKYNLPITDEPILDPVPVSKIYIMNTGNHITDLEFEPITGLAKMNAIGRNTYRRHFLIQMQKEAEHHMFVMQLGQHAEIIRMTRPDDLKRLDEFVDQMEESMRA